MRVLHGPGLQGRAVCREMPALEREPVGSQQAAHDLYRLLERVDALAQRRERDPELVMLLVVPRRTVRQLEAAVRRVVDRDGLRRVHGRVPVRHPGDEDAHTDA